MTMTSALPRSTAVDGPTAGRRIMVTLAVIYLGFFAVLMASGADRQPDANPAKLIADYDTSHLAIEIFTYAAVVAGDGRAEGDVLTGVRVALVVTGP